MTYPELKFKAQSIHDKEVRDIMIDTVKKCEVLGLSADECMEMIRGILDKADFKVYELDKETENRIADGGFLLGLKTFAKNAN